MKKLLLAAVILVLLAGCGEDGNAKDVAEDYMDAVKVGDDFDQMEASEGFIDVFDYEYLQTIEVPEEKNIINLNYDSWENYYTDEYASFYDYKQDYKEIFEGYEIVFEDDYTLDLWDGESYKEIHKLLYNVEIANELGEKLFKKAEITVEPGLYWNGEEHLEGYTITDIYTR